MSKNETRYPPIDGYALISDCHCAALVSETGSVDWCCMPRIDSDSCFGRLLDWDKGGFCSIRPSSAAATSSRRYVPETMVLETSFDTPDGSARLYDFFLMDENAAGQARYELVRLVEGRAGHVGLRVDVVPRFDCGEIVPRVRRHAEHVYSAIGSDTGLVIHADMPLHVVKHRELAATFEVEQGQRIRLSIRFEFPELVEAAVAHADPAGADDGLVRTCDWWRAWCKRIRLPFQLDEQSLRSAIVLKSLSYERTGAIVAAPTTSLPEWVGGQRNWDYRFSWVRDSVFTVRALYELGCVREAERFLQFVQRSSAGSAQELQIMYGVDGKRRLTEIELDFLEGYRQSKPVRVGNLASRQNQFDIYGEILEMAWEGHTKGGEMEPQYWEFLVDVVNAACIKWPEPDHGIWEVRGGPRHHVYSKAMCWGALEYGIRLAQEKNLPAPLDDWIATRARIRKAIETEGYDHERQIFVQAFDNRYLDASLLRLPRIGFIAYDDPRMLRTVDAICRDLDRGGLLLRYDSPDGLPGREGVFVPCTFWMVSCLAFQGRHERAWAYYERALQCANRLGLFSEEYDVENRQMLGNFPQALTHVSQLMARLALAGAVPSVAA